MKFQEYINKLSTFLPIYREIGRLGVIKILEESNGKLVLINSEAIHKLSTKSLLYLDALWSCNSFSQKLGIIMISKAVGHGIKLFQPTAVQLKILTEMTINLRFDDYAQPFDTIIIDFPEDFSEVRIVNSRIRVDDNEDISISETVQMKHRPKMAILHMNRESRIIIQSLLFDDHVGLNIWHKFGDETLESWIVSDESHDDTSLDEMALAKEILRGVLNYCLLLDEVGIMKRGPLNSRHYERLSRQVEKNNKHSKSNHEALALMPMIYDLQQEVKLYRSVDREDQLSENTGRVLTPHHRRGYYRMQRYGVGLSERKRIRIAPVFVNSKLFIGDVAKTIVTYK